jgi:hypothetical protein
MTYTIARWPVSGPSDSQSGYGSLTLRRWPVAHGWPPMTQSRASPIAPVLRTGIFLNILVSKKKYVLNSFMNHAARVDITCTYP